MRNFYPTLYKRTLYIKYKQCLTILYQFTATFTVKEFFAK